MPIVQRITPCLWFDDQAEAAVALYTSVFPRSKTLNVARYSEVGREHHGKEPGSVMTLEFELDGQRFTALNGGPIFRFNEAISLQVGCETDDEVDHYWSRLSEGGDPNAQQCGWLKDRFGVSWQVVPNALGPMMSDPDPAKARRVAQAMFQMKKLDLRALRRAYDG
jgi:predicted 3-demethylubiquinone-9 3-methyltransferase (glyoxalase superfamily)